MLFIQFSCVAAYAGAFLYGVTQGMSYQSSGDLASLAAAKIVSNFGPRLTLEEVQKLKEAP